MLEAQAPAEVSSVKAKRPPALENGDHLTRHEFERRYEAMPDLNKAELIEGTVYMPSPIHLQQHARPHSQLMTWLGNYELGTPGVVTLANASIRLDNDNEFQPDGVLFIAVEKGGKGRVSEDDYLTGAPELTVEIASTSASYDLHQKFNVYRRVGIQEYLVWLVLEQQIRWWRLDEGQYTPIVADVAGVIRSQVFPGLWLATAPLLQGDMPATIAVLQQGQQSPEHAEFANRLSAH